MSWPGWCAGVSDCPPGTGWLAAGAAAWPGRAVVTTCTWPPGPWCQQARINHCGCAPRWPGAHVHHHAARIEVFTGPPQIGTGDTRDRLADQGRERTLPQPAGDIIAGLRRELRRHVAGPAAHVVPDTATQPGSVRRPATRGHTATLTPPAALAQALQPTALPWAGSSRTVPGSGNGRHHQPC